MRSHRGLEDDPRKRFSIWGKQTEGSPWREICRFETNPGPWRRSIRRKHLMWSQYHDVRITDHGSE